MNKIKLAIIPIVAILGVVAFTSGVAYASPASEIRDGVNDVGGGSAPALGVQIQDVINMLLFLLGAIAVVMIVIGGFRYTTSNGEASSIKSAKDTILYAVIGLVVAIMAYAIVNFVLTAFIK
jgi:hypothetical protein